jgi:hypothetical protein
MESLHSLERCDSEISEISDAESHFSALSVGVALLVRLCHFQTVMNKLDLLFSFSECVRSKHLPFSRLGLVERGATLTSIEGFNGCHLKTSLIAIVI